MAGLSFPAEEVESFAFVLKASAPTGSGWAGPACVRTQYKYVTSSRTVLDLGFFLRCRSIVRVAHSR